MAGLRITHRLAGIASRGHGLQVACFSTSGTLQDSQHFRLVVVGGGCGGTATANMFAKKLGAGNVAIIEPKEVSGRAGEMRQGGGEWRSWGEDATGRG